MAKQLALDELRRNGRTIDLDERPGGTRTQRVNCAGHQLFAGAVLARDQHAGRRGRDLLDQPDHLTNRLARPDDLVLCTDFLFEPHVFADEHDVLQRVPQRQQNAIRIERLLEEIVGAKLGRFDGGLNRAVARDHHDLCLRVQLADALQRFQAVHPLHLHVQENEVRLEVGIGADGLMP